MNAYFIPKMKYKIINNIQLLRALAAINVIIFHTIGTSTLYDLDTNFLSYFEGWGKNGVDLFFVISGFVIYHSHQNKKN